MQGKVTCKFGGTDTNTSTLNRKRCGGKRTLRQSKDTWEGYEKQAGSFVKGGSDNGAIVSY